MYLLLLKLETCFLGAIRQDIKNGGKLQAINKKRASI